MITGSTTLTSRFVVPNPVLQKIQNSPEFNRPDFQEMLERDQVKIRFQGSQHENDHGEIEVIGKPPTNYFAIGYLKAAMNKIGIPIPPVAATKTNANEEIHNLFAQVWKNN